jgi:sulfur-carrier protein
MPMLWIPPGARDLTAGEEKVVVSGRTVGEALTNVEAIHPGLYDRFCRGGDLAFFIVVVVDGKVSRMGVRQPLLDRSEVRFLPLVAGG